MHAITNEKKIRYKRRILIGGLVDYRESFRVGIIMILRSSGLFLSFILNIIQHVDIPFPLHSTNV